MGYLIPIIILFFLLWLIVLRPQRRRQMQQLGMQDELHLDDEVITAGGIHGYIKQLDDSVLTIEIARGVRVRVDRRAIAGKVQPEEPEIEQEAIEAADESPDESAQTERTES
jgi:preprotein translocase subunit YajC